MELFFPYKREVKLDTLWHSAPKETNRWRLLRITWIDGFIPYYLILTLRRVIVPYHSPTFLTPPLWLLVKGKESNPRNSNSNHNSRKKRKEKKKWKKRICLVLSGRFMGFPKWNATLLTVNDIFITTPLQPFLRSWQTVNYVILQLAALYVYAP